jgi:hypothetical protein
MANLLQSSQTSQTQAPAYYTDYLSNLASVGQGQVGINKAGVYDPTLGAQYSDANALQTGAFGGVEKAASAFQPTLTAAEGVMLNARDATSPLSAASDYLTAAGTSPAQAATGYMSPYTTGVVNQIGNLGQRNIMQNLAPQATSGAVGSGQFGSKRGAEVLGQTIQNANRDILGQQTSSMDKAYQTALETAIKQNQINAQMGTTAANAASQGQTNLTQLGQAAGQLASTNQALNLADINARATLGEQQRTIAQNKALFPLSNLSTLSTILRGYNVPTATKTTAEMSPLSALAGIGTGALGMFTPGVGGTTPWQNLKTAFGAGGAGTGTDLGGGLYIKPDGSIVGGSPNVDSGLSNDDLYAQSLGYANASDMYNASSVNSTYSGGGEDEPVQP